MIKAGFTPSVRIIIILEYIDGTTQGTVVGEYLIVECFVAVLLASLVCGQLYSQDTAGCFKNIRGEGTVLYIIIIYQYFILY